jgi:hypothetical protein
MTSFAFAPVMAGNHFDPFSTGDAYSSYSTTSQPYPPSSSYLDPSFPAALASIDSYSAVNAYSEAPRSQDPFPFGMESSAQDLKASQATHQPYSPAASPVPPPQLSTSSESGASVHSTSSSAMGSPRLHPQYNPEHWSTMMPGQGLGLDPDVSQEPFSQEVFFTTSMDQDAINATIAGDKIHGFVGESHGSFSSQSGPSTLRSPSNSPSPSFPTGLLHGLPSVPVLKSQGGHQSALSPARSPDDTFKTPSIPASAFLPSSPRLFSPPRSQYFDQRRGDPPRPRRNSLLSHQIYPPTASSNTSAFNQSRGSSYVSPISSQGSTGYVASLNPSCSFTTPLLPRLQSCRRRSSPPAETEKLTDQSLADPSIIHPHTFPSPIPYSHYPELPAASPQLFEQPPSPAPSSHSQHGKVKASPNQSPYLHSHQYHPYPVAQRRPSTTSLHSTHSSQRSASFELDDETRERGLCPIPDCGRIFKDLKAHMLTHQNERPEKCPIQTCEYHTKGFARKYDKNRHTLTHYKGTMVCGFCPGSGSAAEKSFNRADVFKRHLTSVHGVEQTPPNSRKKSPSGKKAYSAATHSGTAGTCSTCSVTFANAQEFYEHLDDCVLRVVQQIDPSEAINQKHLAAISESKEVKETLERNGLSSTDYTVPEYSEHDEDDDEEEEVDNDDANDTTYGSRNPRSGKGSMKGKQKTSGFLSTPHSGVSNNRITKASTNSRGRTGLTWSKGGVALHGPIASASGSGGRKKRKNYPASWGCSTDKMKMKKRVLCVYDGPRRLWKDDMMLDQEFEVRVKIPGSMDSRSYVTDLDVQTLKRAEAIHGATDEERGPWRPDNVLELSPHEGFTLGM